MKNPLPLLMILLLILIIAFGLYAGSGTTYIGPEPEQSAPPECEGGEGRACSIGECNGTSVCVGGSWGACRWNRTCTSGSRLPCVRSGCVYGVKECNECGTGYGACSGADST